MNLEILNSFSQAGLRFAFPTRTLFVQQDGGESRNTNSKI